MSDKGCKHCGRWGDDCRITKCDACGIAQCMGNGGARGSCSVCLYGHLGGWSWGVHDNEPTCQYAGCTNPAVYDNVPGSKKRVCKDCAPRVKISTYIMTTVFGRPKMKTIKTPLDQYTTQRVVENRARFERTDG